MTRPIRVFAVIEASTITGPAKNLIEFSRTADSTVEVCIATFQRGLGGNEFVNAARAAGAAVDVIFERFPFDPSLVGELRNVIARREPDILQTHAVKSHFLMRLSGEWKRRPWIAFHHGYTATDAKVRAYNQLDRWSLRAATRLVTVSGAYQQQLARLGLSGISVLHNAIDTAWGEHVRSVDRAAFRAQLGIAPAAKVILTVGRMSREKAHDDLISAFSLLRTALPGTDLKLLVVGDGPERTRLEALSVDGVRFAGQLRDVAPYYAIADLLALPSLVEGSPNVLLEAMAAAVPVVATEVGGIPEIVRHEESALLVPPRDPAALARAMERVLTDESLASKLVECAKRTVEIRHSPQGRARWLTELYSDVAAQHVNSPGKLVH